MFESQRASAAKKIAQYGAVTTVFRNSSSIDEVLGQVIGQRQQLWKGKGLLSNFSYEMKDGTRTRVDSLRVLLPSDAIFEQDDVIVVAGKEYIVLREMDVNPNGETPIIRIAEVRR